MRITLHIWRQPNARTPGRMVRYEVPDVNHGDVVPGDARRVERGPDRQGRGAGGVRPRLPRGHLRHVRRHGQRRRPRSAAGTTLCQLHMRHFKDGDVLYVEPWRAKAFPVVKDLVVDRSAFDRIIAAGGYISVSTGSAPDGNAVLVPKEDADRVHGCGGLHRLRRLRGDVSQCLRGAVHGRQDRASGPAAAGPAGARYPRDRHGGSGHRGGLRQLHQHRRVRSGLPQGDQARSHRAHEPRLYPRSLVRDDRRAFAACLSSARSPPAAPGPAGVGAHRCAWTSARTC